MYTIISVMQLLAPSFLLYDERIRDLVFQITVDVLALAKAINVPDDDPEPLRRLLDAGQVAMDFADGSGMTLLMHAAWKGKENVAKMLLDMVRMENNAEFRLTLFYVSLQ